jgi:hypothetical protein
MYGESSAATYKRSKGKNYRSIIDKKLKKWFPKDCKYKVTSGRRSRKYNRKVGGAKNSYHIHDRARDIKVKPCCRKKVINAIAAKSPLSLIIYGTHLHIDDRSVKVCLVKTPTWYRYCVAGEDFMFEENTAFRLQLEIDF